MRRTLRPSIEMLETKSLLSTIGAIPIGPPVGVTPPAAIGTTSLAVSLTTDKATYSPGDVVHMTFTETNNTGNSAWVNIGPSIDGFSISNGSQTIWRSNSGITAHFITRRLLLPGQSITLTADWTVSAAPGNYVVSNQLDPKATASIKIIPTASAVAVPLAPITPPVTYPGHFRASLG